MCSPRAAWCCTSAGALPGAQCDDCYGVDLWSGVSTALMHQHGAVTAVKAIGHAIPILFTPCCVTWAAHPQSETHPRTLLRERNLVNAYRLGPSRSPKLASCHRKCRALKLRNLPAFTWHGGSMYSRTKVREDDMRGGSRVLPLRIVCASRAMLSMRRGRQ